MITEKSAAIIKDWSDNLNRDRLGRDAAIVKAIELGATVTEIVAITGLTRARIYQIKDASK